MSDAKNLILEYINFPIVDPHHHIWNIDDPERPNKKLASNPIMLTEYGSMEQNNKSYLWKDYLMDVLNGTNLRLAASVYLECGWIVAGHLGAVGETKWVVENVTLPSNHVVARGIVGTVNLYRRNRGQIKEALQSHQRLGPVKGIRYSVRHDATGHYFSYCDVDNVLENPNFLSNFELLQEFNLSFDLYCDVYQISQAIEMAIKFPQVKIVLDHMACPQDIAKNPLVYPFWKQEMSRLAKCPNVYAKLSGLMAPLGLDYHVGTVKPDYQKLNKSMFGVMIQDILSMFGVDRCMWASNFPVDKVNASYANLVANTLLAMKNLHLDSPFNIKKVFRDNAASFYQLNLNESKL